MKRPPHKREPCAPLPRCDYAGKTLTFTPSSGLGNALLSFASFAALANLTDRHLAVRWARGQNPSSQASFADLFVPTTAVSGAPHHSFVNGALLHDGDGCEPARKERCVLEAYAQRGAALLQLVGLERLEEAPWASCPSVVGIGNAFFTPMLLGGTSGGGVNGGVQVPRALQFGPISRRLLVPHADAIARADAYVSEQTRGGDTLLLSLHVRQSHISGKVNRSSSSWSTPTEAWSSSGPYLRCLETVRAAAAAVAAEGRYRYSNRSTRVYVAADQRSVRTRAAELLGADTVAPPHLQCDGGGGGGGGGGGAECELPNDVGLAPERGAAKTVRALDELLVLARSDALLIWDLRISTYSAVAASWAAHRAAGQPRKRTRPWLGVWCVRCGCVRLPDREVTPPMTVNTQQPKPKPDTKPNPRSPQRPEPTRSRRPS